MSITDVARLAGVTHGTVSRLINDRGGVAAATAERIRAAMRELGYQPPPPNRRRGRKPGPAGIRTGNICLLLVGISRGFIEQPGADLAVASMERLLRQHGLSLVLAYAADLHDLPPVITKRKVDGLLIVGEASDALPQQYRVLPVVWVLSSHARPHTWADHVLPDNHAVGVLAAEYLAGRGHRRMAFINDQPKHPGFAERGDSFLARGRELNIDVDLFIADVAAETAQADSWGRDQPSQQALLVDRWSRAAPRPSGVFVPSDEQASRLYPSLRERGVRPGVDVDIVSCDNQDAWLRHMTPRPASIDLNFVQIGEQAVTQLTQHLSHPERSTGNRILVAPQLIVPPHPESSQQTLPGSERQFSH
jgi:LacI family transcriptional regulator